MKDLVDDFTQRFWHDRFDTRLPVIVTVLLILLLAHSLAKLTWNVVPLPEVEQSAGDEQRQKPRAARVVREQPLANKISNFNLFGKHEKKKVVTAAPVKPAVVPETKLNLKLRGVFASRDKNAARAIIADARGDEDSYKIGSQLPGGATLSEIHADRVILEHNGRFETLKLPVEAADVAGSDSGGSSGQASTARSSVRPVDRNVNRSNIAGLSSTTTDNAELLGQYRNALLNDPNSVMGLINVRPYQKDGQLVGYRLRPGKDRSLLRRFGLRSGDIVTSVNGVPMNNPVKALEVLRDLSTASQISVDVLRNGAPQSFTFSVQ